jgi:hypothetical protein
VAGLKAKVLKIKEGCGCIGLGWSNKVGVGLVKG